MNDQNSTRAYVVHLTDDAIKTIERGAANEIGTDDFLLVRSTIDLKSLRLVLQWAGEYGKIKYEPSPFGKIGDQNKLDEINETIAKLSHITK